tara:strand:- start:2700 stop:2936 length:237 start_codon:yes stop_codon:yes gene_type:complete
MKNSRQKTITVNGEKINIKARRVANNGNIRFSVTVNGTIYKVGIPITDIDTSDILNGEYNTLGMAMEKGFAKWLNETH